MPWPCDPRWRVPTGLGMGVFSRVSGSPRWARDGRKGLPSGTTLGLEGSEGGGGGGLGRWVA